jgi:hypothetical protein
MQLPKQLPNNEADRNILGEFYNLYNNAQWFERADIVENHRTLMKKTLEITVKYNPLLEAKEILGFVHKYNLALSTVVIRNDP